MLFFKREKKEVKKVVQLDEERAEKLKMLRDQQDKLNETTDSVTQLFGELTRHLHAGHHGK